MQKLQAQSGDQTVPYCIGVWCTSDLDFCLPSLNQSLRSNNQVVGIGDFDGGRYLVYKVAGGRIGL